MKGFYKKNEDGTWSYASDRLQRKDFLITLNNYKGLDLPIDGWDYYEKSPDTDAVIKEEAKKYIKRRVDGIAYSDLMNAKLNALTTHFFTSKELADLKEAFKTDGDGVVELAKDEIDSAFVNTQLFLEGGKWKSAEREIIKVAVSTFVRLETIEEIKTHILNYNEISYKK